MNRPSRVALLAALALFALVVLRALGGRNLERDRAEQRDAAVLCAWLNTHRDPAWTARFQLERGSITGRWGCYVRPGDVLAGEAPTP